MVKTNFTFKGKHVTVLAYLRNERPVFTLEIDSETVADEVSYESLVELANSIVSELSDTSKIWTSVGGELFRFNNEWAKEDVDADDQQASCC